MANDETTTSEKHSKEYYIDGAEANLSVTSRTAKGTIDTSASKDKADKVNTEFSPEEVAALAQQNFHHTLETLYEGRNYEFNSPAEVKELVLATAKSINKGITKEGVLLRNTGANSDKHPSYTKVEDVETDLENFCTDFHAKLKDHTQDPQELGAWVVFRFDQTGHFLADGCGKTSRALESYVYMRADAELPKYSDRKEMYQHAAKTRWGTAPETNKAELQDWTEYYKTLFSN